MKLIITITIISFLMLFSCEIREEKQLHGTLIENNLANEDLNMPCPDTLFNSIAPYYQQQLKKIYGVTSLKVYELKNNDSTLVESWIFSRGIPKVEMRYRDSRLSYFFIYENDVDGNILKITTFSADSTFSGDLIYKYDNKGNRIEKYQIRVNGDTINRQFRIYDNLNQNTKLYNLKNGTKYLASVYEYCSKGIMNEIKYFEESGSLKYRSIINLDEFGNQLQNNSTYPDGRVEFGNITSYMYDEHNNIISKSVPKLMSLTIEEQEHDIDLTNFERYEYYTNGLLRSKSTLKDGEVQDMKVYHYKY